MHLMPNMACGAFELCLNAAKIEGFKSLLPKYGILCSNKRFNPSIFVAIKHNSSTHHAIFW
jgi:hypothetical protein